MAKEAREAEGKGNEALIDISGYATVSWYPTDKFTCFEEGRPYHPCPKVTVRIPLAERKQFLRDDYNFIRFLRAVSTLLSDATTP